MIDFNIVRSLVLNLSEYLIIEAIACNSQESMDFIIENLHKNTVDRFIYNLVNNRLIHNANLDGEYDINKLTLRDEAAKLYEKFNSKSKVNYDEYEYLWKEFKDLYPKKSGIRPLHNDQERCRKRYIDLVRKDTLLHRVIISALNAEINIRKIASVRGKFIPDWKLMSTYINQRGWEMYLDIIGKREGEMDIGDGRNTRQL